MLRGTIDDLSLAKQTFSVEWVAPLATRVLQSRRAPSLGATGTDADLVLPGRGPLATHVVPRTLANNPEHAAIALDAALVQVVPKATLKVHFYSVLCWWGFL